MSLLKHPSFPNSRIVLQVEALDWASWTKKNQEKQRMIIMSYDLRWETNVNVDYEDPRSGVPH